MNLTLLQDFIKRAGNLRGLAGPVLIVMILGMMVLPLPPFLLDILFTFNIAIAVMVLLVSMNTTRALDFAAFPTILLITTLLRLSLNVASTRRAGEADGRDREVRQPGVREVRADGMKMSEAHGRPYHGAGW